MDAFIDQVIRGLITYQIGIYAFLAAGLLLYLRKFLRGLKAWRSAVFGLEKTIASRKLVAASTGLVLLILFLVGEFLLVTLVQPRLPSPSRQLTPTMDILATRTATLSSDEVSQSTPLPTTSVNQEELSFECVPGEVEITSPAEGEEVSGTVELFGSVNVENFGSYKYEFSTTGTIDWVTIAAGNGLKLDESLGFWYTSSLTPGDYLLQLVPLDNTGSEMTPCIIGVKVVPEE
jgi:hypothetical protein